MKQMQLFLRSRLSSFGFAFRGLVSFFNHEPNMWIHFFFSLGVFMAAIFFKVSLTEITALVMVTGFVWVAEIFNTAIERVMDFISLEKKQEIKVIKDIAACGVLLAALTALITGAIIFIPKLF